MTRRLAVRIVLFSFLVSVSFAGRAIAQSQENLSRLPGVETLAPPPLDDADTTIADVEVDTTVDEHIQSPWYSRDVLFDSSCWTNSFEFGINGTTGNAESLSFRAGADSKYQTDQNTFKLNFAYARTQANGEETQNDAQLTARNDWEFCDSLWSVFVKQTTDYDEFKAFDVRIAANAGLGYHIAKGEGVSLKGRVGSGFSHEIGGLDDAIVPEALFGLDGETGLTDRQKVEGTIEYLPDWAEWTDYRLESKVSWSIQLDADAKLSLKLTITDRYDSTPEGRKPNDLDYALLLLWKL